MRIDIKPLSTNKTWKGRRFKTPEYKQYEADVLVLLPKREVPEGKLSVYIRFGYSSKGSDIDNAVKPFIDILQKKYGFNDNRIYKLVLEKDIVKKGQEYIVYYLEAL